MGINQGAMHPWREGERKIEVEGGRKIVEGEIVEGGR